jgi:hypothetical protein
MVRVSLHLLMNGWRGSMPLIKVRGVKAYVSKGKSTPTIGRQGRRLNPFTARPEFFAELKAIEDKHKDRPKEAKPGTWGRLVKAYREVIWRRSSSGPVNTTRVS